MEHKLQNNVGFFFIGVLIITLIGFYPTYFIHFPDFTGFSWVHHVHGFIATLWICMLIAQAFLVRAKNYSLHRKIGKASYFIMPLLLLSFFLVARAMYYKNIHINNMNEADALASLSRSGLPDIFYMGTLYSLGILFRKKTSWHMRFFTCTGLMILGPGLGRFAFVNFSPQAAGIILAAFIILIPLVWMIIDSIKKRSPMPLLIFIGISFTAVYVGEHGHAVWWQTFAGWIVNALF